MQTDVQHTRFAHDRGRLPIWLAAPAAALVAALAFSAPAEAASGTPVGSLSYVSVQDPDAMSQGLIMRDGGICDPIRHIGC